MALQYFKEEFSFNKGSSRARCVLRNGSKSRLGDSDRIQDSHRLQVLHLNIRSLRNSEHFIQLKELIKRDTFDVITISESWLNTSVSSLEVNLEGFKLSRLDRLHMGGGGVCVYTRNNLKAKV